MSRLVPRSLSHRIDLSRFGDEARDIAIVADAPARAALAAEYGLPAIEALSGRFRLARARDGRIVATLDLDAHVVQTCVVSLEPFAQTVAERASLLLLTEAQAAQAMEDAVDPDAPDEIVADGGMVDLGAVLAEQLALALDPYPRRPDAVPEAPAKDDSAEEAEEDDAAPHPFAALAKLRGPK
ncbi:MAG: YceD family protein [Acidiphilium sp.]